MKRYVKLIAVMLVLVSSIMLFTACQGAEGPQGPKGEQGAQGPAGDISKLNMFWTDKAEYSESETVTVYFADKEVYTIRKTYGSYAAIIGYINFGLEVTCLSVDLPLESIARYINLYWDDGVFVNMQTYSSDICKVNIKKTTDVEFRGTNDAMTNKTYLNLVICVPGTAFPMATIKNVTITNF